jgi:hypothetical protein
MKTILAAGRVPAIFRPATVAAAFVSRLLWRTGTALPEADHLRRDIGLPPLPPRDDLDLPAVLRRW